MLADTLLTVHVSPLCHGAILHLWFCGFVVLVMVPTPVLVERVFIPYSETTLWCYDMDIHVVTNVTSMVWYLFIFWYGNS